MISTRVPSSSAFPTTAFKKSGNFGLLLNAATGEVLYGKNQDQQFYPASITKVMTALVVLEHCNLIKIHKYFKISFVFMMFHYTIEKMWFQYQTMRRI